MGTNLLILWLLMAWATSSTEGRCRAPSVNPGECPHVTGGTCVVSCQSDEECKPHHKCCKTDCGGTLCTNPIPKPGVCPKWVGPGPCIHGCDNDQSCEGDQKCCGTGCGQQCRDPINPLPGHCPPPPPFGACVEACSSELDCTFPAKCCSNGCGHQCTDPVPRLGVCPLPEGFGICVSLCGSDFDCPLGAKCCSNGCGQVCTNVSAPIPDWDCIFDNIGYLIGQKWAFNNTEKGCGFCQCVAREQIACVGCPVASPSCVDSHGNKREIGEKWILPENVGCGLCTCGKNGNVGCVGCPVSTQGDCGPHNPGDRFKIEETERNDCGYCDCVNPNLAQCVSCVTI